MRLPSLLSSVFLVVEPSKIINTIPQKEDTILLYIGTIVSPNKILLFWEGRLGCSSTRPGDLLERWGTICIHLHIYICVGLRLKGLG